MKALALYLLRPLGLAAVLVAMGYYLCRFLCTNKRRTGQWWPEIFN